MLEELAEEMLELASKVQEIENLDIPTTIDLQEFSITEGKEKKFIRSDLMEDYLSFRIEKFNIMLRAHKNRNDFDIIRFSILRVLSSRCIINREILE